MLVTTWVELGSNGRAIYDGIVIQLNIHLRVLGFVFIGQFFSYLFRDL